MLVFFYISIELVRPTEIPESDVYVCESTYDEGKKQIRRNIQGQGPRKFAHSQLVTPDEVYHFKNQYAPIKVCVKIVICKEKKSKLYFRTWFYV